MLSVVETCPYINCHAYTFIVICWEWKDENNKNEKGKNGKGECNGMRRMEWNEHNGKEMMGRKGK